MARYIQVEEQRRGIPPIFLIIGGVLFLIGMVVLVYFLGRGAGKASGTSIRYSDSTADDANTWDNNDIQRWVSAFNSQAESTFGSICEVTKQMATELTDRQLLDVANAYKRTKGMTIRERMAKMWYYGNGVNPFCGDGPEMLLRKFDLLSIP